MKSERVLILGNRGGTNIGGSFERATEREGFPVLIKLAADAWGSNRAWQKWNWWARGHRPSRLGSASSALLELCRQFSPDVLISTGIAPARAKDLAAMKRLGIRRLNYLTDDPWNPAHRAPWFLDALREYDVVFSPRRANIDQLRAHGCRRVEYLMFGFDPDLHFPDPPVDDRERLAFESDVLFAGGADRERAAWLGELVRSKLNVVLYGSYWDRYSQTRGLSRGQADPATLRKAGSAARVGLCLVRRANRDDHSMRTFEIPAVGACPVVEDTSAHRDLFGAEGECALYFRTPAEMVGKIREALAMGEGRANMARAAHQKILAGGHTYRDRLLRMLSLSEAA